MSATSPSRPRSAGGGRNTRQRKRNHQTKDDGESDSGTQFPTGEAALEFFFDGWLPATEQNKSQYAAAQEKHQPAKQYGTVTISLFDTAGGKDGNIPMEVDTEHEQSSVSSLPSTLALDDRFLDLDGPDPMTHYYWNAEQKIDRSSMKDQAIGNLALDAAGLQSGNFSQNVVDTLEIPNIDDTYFSTSDELLLQSELQNEYDVWNGSEDVNREFGDLSNYALQANNDAAVEQEKKGNKDRKLQSMKPTVVIKLFNNYFTIEHTNDTDMAAQIASLPYTNTTRAFLREIASGKFVPELVEEMHCLPSPKYYNGSIAVQVLDMTAHNSNETPSQNPLYCDPPPELQQQNMVLLEPVPELLLHDINDHLDSHFPEIESEYERSIVQQKVLHLTRRNLCLDPDPRVSIASNMILFNCRQRRQYFRRKRRRLIVPEHAISVRRSSHTQTGASMSSSSMASPSVQQNSQQMAVLSQQKQKNEHSQPLQQPQTQSQQQQQQQQQTRPKKQDHGLLNYIVRTKWKTASQRDFQREQQEHLDGKKPRKTVRKPKKAASSALLQQPRTLVTDPATFLRNTESFMHNNKPPLTRVIQFQAVNDKTRVWRVDIYQVTSRRFDAILTPANEQPSRWPIGSRHATDLYVKRLKDIFTYKGKTKCIADQEIDPQMLILQQQQQQRRAAAAAAAVAAASGAGVATTTTGQVRHHTQHLQHTHNLASQTDSTPSQSGAVPVGTVPSSAVMAAALGGPGHVDGIPVRSPHPHLQPGMAVSHGMQSQPQHHNVAGQGASASMGVGGINLGGPGIATSTSTPMRGGPADMAQMLQRLGQSTPLTPQQIQQLIRSPEILRRFRQHQQQKQ